MLADRVQLQQVIINLMMNGIEAMQPVTERPRELMIRSQQDDARQVVVTVEDRGVGISAENADRLFNAFFTTKSSGMGMGLSICRSIIEAHGGQISAANNAGPGATFQFTLPLHQEAATDMAEEDDVGARDVGPRSVIPGSDDRSGQRRSPASSLGYGHLRSRIPQVYDGDAYGASL